MQLFVSSVETFCDDGTLESKTEYNLDGEVTHVITYDEHGNPCPVYAAIACLGGC